LNGYLGVLYWILLDIIYSYTVLLESYNKPKALERDNMGLISRAIAMPRNKASLSASLDPELKEVLVKLAAMERRSVSSLLEVWIERAGIDAGIYKAEKG